MPTLPQMRSGMICGMSALPLLGKYMICICIYIYMYIYVCILYIYTYIYIYTTHTIPRGRKLLINDIYILYILYQYDMYI